MKAAVLLAIASLLGARLGLCADTEAAVQDVLTKQAASWNRGDLPAFMQWYAKDCTFMGKPVVHGRLEVLARYRKIYPTPARMGQLTFDHVEVQPVAEHVAIATGNFHLSRSAEGGGDAGGYFSLVLKDVDDDWLIVLDHTTAAR